MKHNNICLECHAMLKDPAEYHPYAYCIIAKTFPSTWRNMIKFIIKNADKFEKTLLSGGGVTDAP